MELKRQLFNRIQEYVDSRLVRIKSKIDDVQNSLNSETKSSAGDKHETSRAMLQLEREKLGFQLADAQKLNEALSKIDINVSSSIICLGSVVFTNMSNYYISISSGEIIYDNQKFYAISPNTPIGQLLMGKTKGEEISFRNNSYKILKIL